MLSSELSGYRLQSASPIELRVYDNEFRPVDRGVGSLERTDLQPGIYHLELRAGASSSDKLIKLEPGQIYEDLGLHLKFYSVLPLPSAEGADGRHLSALQALSVSPPLIGGGEAELVVFIRVVSPRAAKSYLESVKLQLLDAQLEPVRGFDEMSTSNLEDGWCGKSGRLPAGGYLLRVELGPAGKSLDLVLFLSDTWQTLVCIPITTEGLQLESALIQMLPMNSGGFLATLELDQDSALSLEVATSGLAVGRALVPRRQLDRLFDMKFWNPMLGIIAAYCMFDPVVLPRSSRNEPRKASRFRLKSSKDARLLNTVITNLNRLLPGHPDVLAVWELYHTAEGADDRETLGGMNWAAVTWPPMVALGYRQVITSDETDGPSIADGSLADRARFWTVPCGPWTAWRSETTKKNFASTRVGYSLPPGYLRDLTLSGNLLRGVSLFALATVRNYLAEVARTEEQPFSEVVQQLSNDDLSVNTGLGHSQVNTARILVLDLLKLTPTHGADAMKFVAPVIEVPFAGEGRPPERARAEQGLDIEQLHSVYQKELRGYLGARCRSRSDVPDLVQESWILIQSKLDQFNPERGTPAAFVKYWASIAAMRWYRKHKNRDQESLLFADFASKFPESVNEPDIADIVQERGLDPEQLLARDEQYELLLKSTFSVGSPPHQLLAFGFCKILEWRPQSFVQSFSDLTLETLAGLFEDQYRKEAGEDKDVLARALRGLHRALRLRFAEAVPDPATRAAYAELADRAVGTTTPRNYYRTETPEESVSHWVYAVRRRVQRALSSPSPAP